MMVCRVRGEYRAMLKNEETEVAQVQRWQRWVQRTDEVLVEPLCLLYLEAYPLNGLKLFFRKIDYKAHT